MIPRCLGATTKRPPATPRWVLPSSGGSGFIVGGVQSSSSSSQVPGAADYDGDGITDIAAFNFGGPSTGYWRLRGPKDDAARFTLERGVCAQGESFAPERFAADSSYSNSRLIIASELCWLRYARRDGSELRRIAY